MRAELGLGERNLRRQPVQEGDQLGAIRYLVLVGGIRQNCAEVCMEGSHADERRIQPCMRNSCVPPAGT
jgi:hypothetical protein